VASVDEAMEERRPLPGGKRDGRGRRAHRSAGRSFLVPVLLLFSAGVFAPPAESSGSSGGPDLRFSGLFALRFVYDDNIIHYSEEDLHDFAHIYSPGKFSIDTAGDWIVRPRLDLTMETEALTGRDLEIRLRLSSWKYVNNGVKDNESFQLLLKHPGFGRDNFKLYLYHSPESYIRNFRDRPPGTPPSDPMEYADFTYVSNSASLEYWRRIADSWDGNLEVQRSARYYSRPFMENDNWEWRFGGYLTWRRYRSFRVRAEYLYSDVLARGADEVGETRETSDDSDPTYERDSYCVTFSFYPRGRLGKIDGISVSGTHQIYYFTTKKSPDEDPYHAGRKDRVYRVEVSGDAGEVLGPVSLEGGYRFTKRTSTGALEGEGESIGEEKDYTDNRFWLGFEYPF